jgi:hypothetical protein
MYHNIGAIQPWTTPEFVAGILGPCAPAGAYAPAQNAYLRGYNNAITCKQPDLQLLEQGLPTGDKARNGEIVPLLALRPHGLHPASHALPSRLLVT